MTEKNVYWDVKQKRKRNKNRQENEHVENLVFDVAAALRLCFIVKQPCLMLPHKKQKFVVADRCRKADVKQTF